MNSDCACSTECTAFVVVGCHGHGKLQMAPRYASTDSHRVFHDSFLECPEYDALLDKIATTDIVEYVSPILYATGQHPHERIVSSDWNVLRNAIKYKINEVNASTLRSLHDNQRPLSEHCSLPCRETITSPNVSISNLTLRRSETAAVSAP